MQYIVLEFADTVDLTGVVIGAIDAALTTGTASLTGATVFSKAQVLEPPEPVPYLVPHTHDEGATGPAIAT